MKISRKDLSLFSVQLLIGVLLVLMPVLITSLSRLPETSSQVVFWASVTWILPFVVVYMLNFYVFLPLLYHRHKGWFALANIVLIALVNNGIFWFDPIYLPVEMQSGYYFFVVAMLLLNGMAVVAALAVRNVMRMAKMQRLLAEQQHKNATAELAWLKNQLNPHFLFNTLNNISSLTQIDADAAQDSIGQLSELLHYALYETSHDKVPLRGELSFMRNYIDLMKLRCNERTEVLVDMPGQAEGEVAPLLFISLIENAFKHGVSSSMPSHISIRMAVEHGTLTFECDNTYYPKDAANRSGSGVGLENTRRRLQLIYPDRHQWEQTLENGIYHVKLTLQL